MRLSQFLAVMIHVLASAFAVSAEGQERHKNERSDPCFQASSDKPGVVIQLCSSFLAQHPSKIYYERALNRRGLAYHRLGRHREALADFDALIASHPTGAGYVDNRRAVFQAMGLLEKALADANAAVRLAPQRAFVYHGRAGVLFDLARYDAAVDDYTKAYELPEKSSFLFSLYDRGRTYFKLRKFEQAIHDFTSVFRGDASFTYALRERALTLIEMGQFASAERDLQTFLQREPNDPEALSAMERIKRASHGSVSAHPSDIKAAPPTKRSASTGTAFFVSQAGHLLTNAHVVKECTTVGVSQPGITGWMIAEVLGVDGSNDLALLRVSPPHPLPIPPLFRRQLRLGEDVSVFGFPLTGLVASSGNFTKGNITALAGIRDDTTQMQLAAPIQPGNSGGPVLDQTGAVVGVVVGKLNALTVAKATGNFPEQINFAIKANTALGFLEANGVQAAEVEKGAAMMAGPDLADHARRFTVLIGCLRE